MVLARAVAGGICANCGQRRPFDELLAFWPVGSPDRRQYVCRPSMPVGGFVGCFRDAVGTVEEHVVAEAAEINRSAA